MSKNIVSIGIASTLALASFALLASCNKSVNTLNPSLTTPTINAQSVGTSSYNGLKNGDIIPGEFIVKYKNISKNSFSNNNGVEKIKDLGGEGSKFQLVKIDMTKTTNALSSDPNVEYIEQNRVITLPNVIQGSVQTFARTAGDYPNDPDFVKQWHHKNMQSVAGWQSMKKKETVIAILDTGIDGKHPDLKNLLLAGFDAYGSGREYIDMQGHGTHCAGIAAAQVNNGIGVAGVSNNTKLISVKVLQDSGAGSYAAVVNGIVWAANNPNIDVMSMSLGGPAVSQAMVDGIDLARKNGKIVVAAMGNDGTNKLSYPAAVKGVLAVGATDPNDAKASFSQWGPHIGVTAPGVNIYATFPTYKSGMPGINYGAISGTSMACPAVAGMAAVIKSVNPSLTPDQIADVIKKSADDMGTPGFDEKFGFGRVNLNKAVKAALLR